MAAGKRIPVPLLVLWGAEGNLRDAPVLEEWRRRALDVCGIPVPGSAHYIPEEQPEAVVHHITAFADELGL